MQLKMRLVGLVLTSSGGVSLMAKGYVVNLVWKFMFRFHNSVVAVTYIVGCPGV